MILAASKKPEYAALIDTAVAYGKQNGKTLDEQVEATLDRLLVQFGKEILNIIPGKVSTEVDAKLSFDTQASVDKALQIIKVRSHKFTRNDLSREFKADPCHLAVRRQRYLQGPCPDQDCLHLRGHQGRSHPPVPARHQLQPDPHVLSGSGHCRC